MTPTKPVQRWGLVGKATTLAARVFDALYGLLRARKRLNRTEVRVTLRWQDGKIHLECPEEKFCYPEVEHGPGEFLSNERHSIRDVCLKCGKRTEWEKVLL